MFGINYNLTSESGIIFLFFSLTCFSAVILTDLFLTIGYIRIKFPRCVVLLLNTNKNDVRHRTIEFIP